MRWTTSVVSCALLFCRFALGQTSVASYISTEYPIAKANLLANIGSSGSKSSGAKAGIVIASPSNSNPNYLFTWTRDSALVFAKIIDLYVLLDCSDSHDEDTEIILLTGTRVVLIRLSAARLIITSEPKLFSSRCRTLLARSLLGG
jgi:hypothetical protein